MLSFSVSPAVLRRSNGSNGVTTACRRRRRELRTSVITRNGDEGATLGEISEDFMDLDVPVAELERVSLDLERVQDEIHRAMVLAKWKNIPDLVTNSRTGHWLLLQVCYDGGVRSFSNSNLLDVREKSRVLPDDVSWRMRSVRQETARKVIDRVPNLCLVEGIETSALLDELNAAAVNNRRYNADRLCKVTLLCTPNTTRENLLSLIDHLQSTCPALTLHGLHFPNPTLTHPEDATLSNLHPFLLDANTTGDLRRDIANAANLPSPYQLEFSLQLQSVDDVQRLAHVITSGASALHLDFLLP